MAIRYGDRTRGALPASSWLGKQPEPVPFRSTTVPNVASVTVTADSVAHTYGAWTELISSLSNDTRMLSVSVAGIRANGTNTASVVSLGIGASGSETEFVAFATGGVGEAGAAYAMAGIHIQLPIGLPSGTRIAARFQSIRALVGVTCLLNVTSFNADSYGFATTNRTLDTLGLDVASSTGVSIAGSNVYSEIVASTTQAYRGLVLVPSMAATATGNTIAMTVAVGSSGSEIDLGSVLLQANGGETIISTPSYFVPAFIPAGSRIAVKQSSAATFFDATVIGVPF